MRKIMVETEVSVDGAMGGENADFWNQVFPFHSTDVQEYLDDLLFMPDALLMGQKTYEFVAGFLHIGTETATPPERPRPNLDAITEWVRE